MKADKKKKKLILFTNGLKFGGTERVVSLFINELAEHYQLELVLIYDEIDFELNSKITKHILSINGETRKSSVLSKLRDYLIFFRRYKKLIKNETPDVSISFLMIPNVINAASKLFNPKLKAILSERCFPSIMYRYNGFPFIISKLLISFFYNKGDLVFSNSESINRDLKDNFNIKTITAVIYNPVVTNKTQPKALEYKEGNNFKVITVGRLTEVKNHGHLIEVFNKLPNNFNLNIYGNGELYEVLTAKIKSLDCQTQIFLHGSVSQVNEKLKENHCFVLTSITEGFPNALLEAMAMGLPVISTNCKSGPLELLNQNIPFNVMKGEFYKGMYGILVSVNDGVALEKAIRFLEENPSERRKYGRLSFERAKDYDTKTITIQLKNIIENLN